MMLESFPGFATASHDVVRNVVLDRFGANKFDASSGRDEVLIRANWVETKNLTVITSLCSSSTDISYDGLSFVRQYFEIGHRGRLEFAIGRKTFALSDAIPSVVVPSSVSFRVKAQPDHQIISLRIENDALKNILRALVDDDVVSDVTFDDLKAIGGPWYKSLRQAVIQFMADCDLMGPTGSMAARDSFAQALMTKFLFCNSHAFSSKLEVAPKAPSIAQLRQIEDFIEANWRHPLDIEELARIFKISVRSIFRHFKQHRGVTPFEYNKSVRLQKAREMLESDFEGRGVVAIAMQCGFQSVGHFSRYYRETFLELPSETQRRAGIASGRR